MVVLVVGGGGGRYSYEAWQHPSHFCYSSLARGFLDIVIQWAALLVSLRQSRWLQGGRHAVPVKVKQGRQLWKLVALLWLNTNAVLEGILGLLIMSQGPVRNNSLRIDISKWSVKVGRLEHIAHRRRPTGRLLVVDDSREIPLHFIKGLVCKVLGIHHCITTMEKDSK